jgi:hypothetical protein
MSAEETLACTCRGTLPAKVADYKAAPTTAQITRANEGDGGNGIAANAEFSGTFTLQRFVRKTGRLLALGMLTDIPGVQATSRNPLETVRIPVTAMSRSCEPLRVDLGPIDLDVQGRTVHINDFTVQVSDAGSGPLGQSLCSVANAPDDMSTLAPLLNELLELIGCLMRGAGGCARQST